MSESKVYELLKDLPNVNAGTLIKLSRSGSSYTCTDKNGHSATFTIKLIESNPDWFKLVAPQPPVKRIEVQSILNQYEHTDGYSYEIRFNRVLQKGEGEKIKKAIEFVLNPEPVEEKQEGIRKRMEENLVIPAEKDWEVVGFRLKSNGDIIYKNKDNTFGSGHTVEAVWLNSIESIHSIKRLSDNEVFTVGSKVCWNWNPCSSRYLTIDRFEVEKGYLIFFVKETHGSISYDFLSLSKKLNLTIYNDNE